MRKLYIAGPDVFEPDPVGVGDRLKTVARAHGFEPLYPMDNALPAHTNDPSRWIFEANAQMIREADVVVANLNPFRGAEPDSGTVWEVGFACGLGKPVVGYLRSSESMVRRALAMENRPLPDSLPYVDSTGRFIEDFGHPLNLMLVHSLRCLVVGEFDDALAQLAAATS